MRDKRANTRDAKKEARSRARERESVEKAMRECVMHRLGERESRRDVETAMTMIMTTRRVFEVRNSTITKLINFSFNIYINLDKIIFKRITTFFKLNV